MPDGGALGTTQRSGIGPVATLPNLVSFSRLCAVPVDLILILRAAWIPALAVFLLAAASDALDGFLARRGRHSRLGAVLDPLADKALLVSVSVCLAAARLLPGWYAVLVVFREAVIVGGVLLILLLGERVAMRPLASSKLNTLLQGLLLAAVLACAAMGRPTPPVLAALTWLTAATTLLSGAAYVRAAARQHGR